MSTRVGTLQAPRAGGSILLAAFLASVVMLTIAMVAISFDRDQGRQGEATFVGRQLVTTPSQLSAGLVGGTAANTPSELFGSRGDPAAVRQQYVSDNLGTNTPSELSGGDGLPAGIYARHQRR